MDKKIKIFADTSDFDKKIIDLVNTLKLVSNQSILVKTDVSESIKNIDLLNTLFKGIEDQLIKVDVQADATKIDEIKTDLEEIQGKDVVINTEVNSENIDTLKDDIESISGKDILVGVVTNTDSIDLLKNDLDSIEDKDVEINVNTNTDSIDSLNTEINNIEGKEVEVKVETNTESIDNLSDELNSIQDKSVEINTEVNSDGIDQLNSDLNDLENKDVEVNVNTNSDSIDQLKSDLEGIQGKDIQITTETNSDSIDELKSDINDLEGKDVIINTQVNSESISGLEDQIQELEGKDIEVNVNTNTEQIDSLNNELDSIEGKDVQVNVNTNSESVDDLKVNLNSIDNKDVQVNVETNTDSIDSLNDELNNLEGKDVQINTNVNSEDIDQLNSDLDNLEGKDIQINVNADTQNIDNVKEDISSIEDKTIQIDTQVNTDPINELNSSLDSISDKTIEVNVDSTNAIENVDVIKTDLDSIEDKSVTVNINNEASTEVQNIKSDLDEIPEENIIKYDVKTNRKEIDKLIADLKANKDPKININLDNTKAKKGVTDLKKDIDSKLKDTKLTIGVDNSKVIKDIDLINTKFTDVKTDLQKRIEVAIDTQKSATSIKEFRNAQKELQGLLLQIGDEGSKDFQKVAVAIGTGNDKMEDFNNSIKSLSKAPIENLSAGFKGVRDSILSLNFEEFNDRVKNLSVVSKQVSFGDLSKSIGETGKSFLTLGKLIATNPLGLLITGVTLLIANFDSLKKTFGPIFAQLEFIGDLVGVVTDAFFALTDAIGLTSKAEDEAAEASKQASEQRLENITKSIQNINTFNDALNGLSDENKKRLVDEFNLYELRDKANQNQLKTQKQVYDDNISLLEQQADEIRKSAELIDLTSKAKKEANKEDVEFSQEEKDRLKEITESLEDNLNKRVALRADHLKKIQDIQDQSAKNVEDLQVSLIKNDTKRAVEESKLNEERRLKDLDTQIQTLKESNADFSDLEKEKTLVIKSGQKERSEIYQQEADKVKEGYDKVREFVKSVNEKDISPFKVDLTAIDDEYKELIKLTGRNQALLLELQAAYYKKRADVFEEESKKIVDDQKKIDEEIIAEQARSYNEQIEFDRSEINRKYAERLKIIQDNIKKEADLIKSLEDEIANNREKGIDTTELDKQLATLQKSYEDATKSVVILKQNQADETKKFNQDIIDSETNLQLETEALRAKNLILEQSQQNLSAAQRIESLNKLYDIEKKQRQAALDQAIADANGNEAQIANLKEEFRNADLVAEQKHNDDIQDIRDKQLAKTKATIEALQKTFSIMDGIVKDSTQSIFQGIGNVAKQLTDQLAVFGDENATFTDKLAAGAAVALEALSAINQVLQQQSKERIDLINQELETSLIASEEEKNTKLKNLEDQKDKGIITQEQYSKAVDNINKDSDEKNKVLQENARKKENAIKKKAFDQEKAIKIGQTIASGAQAVVTALTAGAIAGPILAVATGAITAAQIGIIASQKFPESGSSGGGGGGSVPDISVPDIPTAPQFEAQDFVGIGQTGNPAQTTSQPIIIQNNISANEVSDVQNSIDRIETRAQILN